MTAGMPRTGGETQDVDGRLTGQTLAPPMLRALHQHLSSSLFNSTCADIRIRAFERTYALHRIFLVQSTFFHSLLVGEFQEAQSRLGVWRSDQMSDPVEHTRSTTSEEKGDNVMQLHFDDPNITRPAFEYCIAALYGAAPQLVLPSWSSPSPAHPLTNEYEPEHLFRCFTESSIQPSLMSDESDGDNDKSMQTPISPQHPATPRFLLSLLATATYLGIPSVASQAVTLVLCSITPFTVSHYLRFALGYGIQGAMEAKERRGAPSQVWDWELEGPAWGLANLAQGSSSRSHKIGSEARTDAVSTLTQTAQAVSLHDRVADDTIDDTKEHDPSTESQTATLGYLDEADASMETYDTEHCGFFYGAQSDKIGEACSCWLLRWGADVLLAEEQLHRHNSGQAWLVKMPDYILPFGKMPVPHSLAQDDHPNQVATLLRPPHPTVWRHPRLGGIPAQWVRSIISSDSFWIREEWDRYDVARRVVAMRRSFVGGPGLSDESDDEEAITKQTSQHDTFDVQSHYSKRSRPLQGTDGIVSAARYDPAEQERDEAEYVQLFSEGIYYTHMSFTRLSAISNETCPHNGLPYAPMHVLQSALWTQSELKNIILSKDLAQTYHALDPRTRDDDDDEDSRAAMETPSLPDDKAVEAERELGLVSCAEDFAQACTSLGKRGRSSRSPLGDKGPLTMLGGVTPSMHLFGPAASASPSALEGLLSKRFFAVPVDDTVRMGENMATLVSPSQQASGNGLDSEDPLRRSVEGPTGVASAPDANTLTVAADSKHHSSENFFGLENAVRSGKDLGKVASSSGKMEQDGLLSEASDPTSNIGLSEDKNQHTNAASAAHEWTGFEPMRIGVEFYDVDRLSEKQRLYSPSFFYAGSVWNLYVQTVKKPKGLQLGIYLHRQNCSDSLPSPSMPSHMLGTAHTLSGQQANMPRRTAADDEDGMTSIVGADRPNPPSLDPQTPRREDNRTGNHTSTTYAHGSVFYPSQPSTQTPQRQQGGRASAQPRTAAQATSPYSLTPSPMPAREMGGGGGSSHNVVTDAQLDDMSASRALDPTSGVTTAGANTQSVEIPYLDQRRVLRAYFSIHCPSPMGSSLTKFSSRPDNFTLSQSWGWKSSSLLGAVFLEDGMLGSARSQISQTFRCIVTMGVV